MRYRDTLSAGALCEAVAPVQQWLIVAVQEAARVAWRRLRWRRHLAHTALCTSLVDACAAQHFFYSHPHACLCAPSAPRASFRRFRLACAAATPLAHPLMAQLIALLLVTKARVCLKSQFPEAQGWVLCVQQRSVVLHRLCNCPSLPAQHAASCPHSCSLSMTSKAKGVNW